jgi:hypothetical protein
MRKSILFVSLFVVFASESQACQRCGLFGRLCRYYKAPVQYYAPAAVVKKADVFVVQNNYPPAIAAAYAQQGNSVYGYQAAAQAYFVNPAEVLRQSAELSKAASVTATLGLTGYNQTAQTQLALQAAISEPLAKGHAAAQVLTAAGLNQQSVALQQQTLALRVTTGVNGQLQVQQVQAEQLPIPAQPVGTSVISQKCAKCHGLSLAEPKGGVFLDAEHRLDCTTAMKAIKLIKTDKMPKDSPPLTAQEKGLILDELLSLVQE